MKEKLIAGLVLVTAAVIPTLAMAEASDFMIRVRAAHISPANKSEAIPALGVAANDIEVSAKTIPEVDISYFMTNNLAAELILTVPQKHDVSVKGLGKIGSFKHLPPTLLAQYHFAPREKFNPYVGAGVNYTRISSVNLNVAGVGDLDLDKSSVGGALQAGLDVAIDKNWSFNLDAKYIQIRSDVKLKATGAKVSEVKVDPTVISVGLGYRF